MPVLALRLPWPAQRAWRRGRRALPTILRRIASDMQPLPHRLFAFLATVAALVLFVWLLFGGPNRGHRNSVAALGHGEEETQDAELRRDGSPGEGRIPSARELSPDTGEKTETEAMEETPHTSKIRGQVLDDAGSPFTQAEVEVLARKKERVLMSQRVSSSGEFSFSVEAGHPYIVRIREDSLSDGYLPPWLQGIQLPRNGNRYKPWVVEPQGVGDVEEVVLYVFKPATVLGHVVGSENEPLKGVEVFIRSAAAFGQPASLGRSSQTDESGQFSISAVYPGKYRATFYVGEAVHERYHSGARPMPVDFEVDGGAVYDLGTVQFRGGSESVRGRVYNQDGEPFVGLEVGCYPSGAVPEGWMPYGDGMTLSTTTTDSRGNYILEHLPEVPVNVRVGLDYPDRPLGERVSAFWIPPEPVDLRAPGRVHVVPDLVLPESRPFFVRGQVRLAEEWAESNRVDLGDVEYSARYLEEPVQPIRGRLGIRTRETYRVDKKTGDFEWACETPREPLVITFRVSRGIAEPIAFDLTPVPNGERVLEVRFPR